jgi:hypothetical protein
MGHRTRVRLSGERIGAHWGQIIVWVDGRTVANFLWSTDPLEQHPSFYASKLDALEAARIKARQERANLTPRLDFSMKGPRTYAADHRERAFRRFRREVEDLGVTTTGHSICGPKDKSPDKG